ncbi:hypothetical protein BDP27DRAFT_1325217 [Rhodocollybia butyracea]|uniref:Uncharacterized protein n=1 Tax=Rhodocollybia butyracea TaxID=206335 RepID=A0A9P5PPG3_9AGAR|nr:hypothetical protein BDP27DRAFT_1325217 [Rhodocollybia butyracea]
MDQIDFPEHAKLEADLAACHNRWKKLKTTIDIWENQISRLNLSVNAEKLARFQKFKEQLAVAQSQLDAAYARRLEYGSSSLTPLLNHVEKQDAKTQELHKLATELNQKLAEADALKKEVNRKPLVSASTNHVAQDSNDIGIESAPAGIKRRRLSSGYEDTSSSNALEQSKAEISRLHRILKDISKRVVEVENSFSAQETEMRDLVRAYIHDRAESDHASGVQARVDAIQQDTDHIGKQLEELSTWIAQIIADNRRIEMKHEELTMKNQQEENELRELLNRIEEQEKIHIQDKTEVEALNAALTAYREKPVSPPSSPFDPEATMLDMEDQIKELVRNAIKPHVEETRSALVEDLQRYDSELYSMLWSKLSLTTKVIGAVSEATNRPTAS